MPEGAFDPNNQVVTFPPGASIWITPQMAHPEWGDPVAALPPASNGLVHVLWSDGKVRPQPVPPPKPTTMAVDLPINMVKALADDRTLWGEDITALRVACRAAIAPDSVVDVGAF